MLKCLNPYMGSLDGGMSVYPFPCGSCINCRKRKSQEWATRIFLESKSHKHIAFVTLTYSPEHIPQDYNLKPSDLSAFIKRLRRNLERKGAPKIRFFGAGEYGDFRGRPHYHLIIFGLSEKDFDMVHLSWKLGMIDCQAVRDSRSVAGYVAAYVTKKMKVSNYGDRVPPFNRQSQGIGKDFVDALPVFTHVLRIGKFFVPLGRYLRNRLAQRFGILDEVKLEGLYQLKKFMQEKVLAPYYEFHEKSRHFIVDCIEAWKIFIEGEKELAYSKFKLIRRLDL